MEYVLGSLKGDFGRNRQLMRPNSCKFLVTFWYPPFFLSFPVLPPPPTTTDKLIPVWEAPFWTCSLPVLLHLVVMQFNNLRPGKMTSSLTAPLQIPQGTGYTLSLFTECLLYILHSLLTWPCYFKITLILSVTNLLRVTKDFQTVQRLRHTLPKKKKTKLHSNAGGMGWTLVGELISTSCDVAPKKRKTLFKGCRVYLV